ncbi:LytTR family transcriptional regulator DNA-binding domain-containing protein [Maribellus sp. YY47]|uniref:LytR/AlgR family response regulator transcription factor n=1 Tax=Maribellus sp. YY47 TaxID=2929486 RepID=UPI002001CCE7|nr:LytTR family transcriptional regulator DNA-binding domain-containing protein [Maribellus sp. YY47]MCK3686322.1 LytTR family transcriptional regulator DNA-binding domain-containing protein [Maribellus sp. YY47]
MTEKLRTIIVEDEELARNLMKNFLSDIESVEIIAECENGFEGVKMINELKPDLVFLDIQMPKITGFEMLELLEHKPQIIFATAYDQYALKAFEFNAADYLLKPYSKDRLVEAVAKVEERIQADGRESDVAEKISEFPREGYLDRVVVKDRNKIHIAPVDAIRYIESMDDYVMIYTTDGRWMKQKTMKYFETVLNPNNFVRIHRSYIVKVDEISEIQQYEKESYVVILHDKTKLKVSKTGYKNLKDILNF